MVATKDNFINMLKDEPRVLHISCHGLEVTNRGKKTTDLLFEQDREKAGEGFRFNQKRIEDYLKNIPLPNLQLVVLTICHSERIADAFLNDDNGNVEHVICIKKEQEVLDTAAIQFTRTLYRSLMSDKKVCQAFEEARSDVLLQQGK